MVSGDSVSVIVPCYNEMRTLGSVVEIACAWNRKGEVIVVNDGSTDESDRVLEQFTGKIKIISNSKNSGKGYAMAAGVKIAAFETLIFLDADTCGLTTGAIDALAGPVLVGKADMTLGMVRFFRMPFTGPRGDVTGFRATKRSLLLPYITEMQSSGYGVEWVLNGIVPDLRVIKVDLKYVYIIDKFAKKPKLSTIASYLSETKEIYFQIFRTLTKRVLHHGKR